jgi:hypothetical protein
MAAVIAASIMGAKPHKSDDDVSDVKWTEIIELM